MFARYLATLGQPGPFALKSHLPGDLGPYTWALPANARLFLRSLQKGLATRGPGGPLRATGSSRWKGAQNAQV